jgi:septal ring factor EnvC (AmiA/AmiB activator)
MRTLFSGVLISCFGVLTMNCTQPASTTDETAFTKEDSVVDHYLAYQDSILQVWNVMINDDNQKISAMRSLLHELSVSNPEHGENFASYEERLNNLHSLRYDQRSIANKDIVEEYDFASNSLISELLSEAESQPEFAYNTTLQTLAEEIRLADQRVSNYREDYDAIVSGYNQFLEENKLYLTDIDPDSTINKKPLFQMVYEELP